MQKKIEYFPLRIALSFLVLTELLFWLGPVKYSIPNNYDLFVYLAIVNLAFYYGYRIGVKKFRPSTFKVSSLIVKFLIIVGLVLSAVDLFSMWSMRGISVSFESLLSSISNPGQAYYSEIADNIETSIFLLLLSPIKWASIPIGIYSWRKMTKFYKTCILAIIFVTILMWLGVGVRKGVFDILIIIFFAILASFPQIITNHSNKRKFKLVTFILIILFLVYFIFSNLSRGGSTSLKDIMTMTLNSDIREIYLFLPNWLIIILLSITGYLVQGYYSLALSLHMGLRQVVPFGMSWFTISIANKFGYDPTPLTYMNDLERYGIDMTGNWHSIYVWLANDFSFIGVPIVIFVIGYFFAQSWCDSLKGNNLLSFPVMALFVLMVFYFYANNQVMSFSFVPFFVCFSLYQLSRFSSIRLRTS